MSETKKDNGFTRWSKNTLSFGSLIKYSIAGGSSSAVELIVHMVLLIRYLSSYFSACCK